MNRRSNVKRTRSDGKMTFLVKAEKFIEYTLVITNKPKKFPKKVRFTLTNRIVDLSFDVYHNLLHANEIYPLNREQAERRLELQRLAITSLKELDFLIRLSRYRGHIDDHELKHWSYLMSATRKTATGWHKSDKERYK